MSNAHAQLNTLITNETTQTVSQDITTLSAAIEARGNVLGILFYGSGLWKEAQDDTIYDFYVIADRYTDIDKNKLSAALGCALPPNVYYMEIKSGSKMLRCKYALIRTDQFLKAAKGKTITPQIWARFAQPARIIYSRDEAAAKTLQEALTQCVLTFHRKTLPLTTQAATPRDIWLRGLQETYKAELRSEKPERTQALFDASADAFTQRTQLACEILNDIKRGSKFAPALSCAKRPLQKLIAFLRLAKATLTFENGVDYALWKIERQSGVSMKANDFQRRYPLIGAWPLVWKLWRKGGFR